MASDAEKIKREALAKSEKVLTDTHYKLLALAEAAKAVLGDHIGLAVVMTRLHEHGTGKVEDVVRALATLPEKLEGKHDNASGSGGSKSGPR